MDFRPKDNTIGCRRLRPLSYVGRAKCIQGLIHPRRGEAFLPSGQGDTRDTTCPFLNIATVSQQCDPRPLSNSAGETNSATRAGNRCPVGGHSCNEGMIPRFHRKVVWAEWPLGVPTLALTRPEDRRRPSSMGSCSDSKSVG